MEWQLVQKLVVDNTASPPNKTTIKPTAMLAPASSITSLDFVFLPSGAVEVIALTQYSPVWPLPGIPCEMVAAVVR